MLGRKIPQANGQGQETNGGNGGHPITLLTIVGEQAKMDGKFDIADSIQIECEVNGELNVGGKLVIGEKGVVNANVQTVDAVIMGIYEGNMVATGNVEIATTGRVSGNISTDSLVISKGGFFNGNVIKIKDVEGAAKPVYLVEEKPAYPASRRSDPRANDGRINDSRVNDGRGNDRSGRMPYAVEEDR
jgi:cytoskeletal protein CcmA (bactofilin family)